MTDICRRPDDTSAQQQSAPQQFYDCWKPGGNSHSAGNANERTAVTLGWSDTTWSLARDKYNDTGAKRLDAIEAIYELNGMTPKVVMKNGSQELIAPQYGAGQKLILPAENEIQDLRRKFWERMSQQGIKRMPRRDNESPIVAVEPPSTGGDTGSVKPPAGGSGGDTGSVKPPAGGTGGDTGSVKPPAGGTGGDTGSVKPPAGGTGGDTGSVKPPAGGTGGDTGSVKPPAGGTETKSSDMERLAIQLQVEHNKQVVDFEKSVANRGAIGWLWDGIKNNLSSSGTTGNILLRPTTYLLDSDLGSDATRDKLNKQETMLNDLRRAAQEGNPDKFNSLYKDITGKDADFKDTSKTVTALKRSEDIEKYISSQRNGVEFISDTTAFLGAAAATAVFSPAAAGTLRLMASDALGTGVFKYGIKSLTGDSADFKHDFVSGATVGLLGKPAEIAGGLVSQGLATRLGLGLVEKPVALSSIASLSGFNAFGKDLVKQRMTTLGLDWSAASIGKWVGSSAAKYGTAGSVFGFGTPLIKEVTDTALTDHKFNPLGAARDALVGIPTGFVLGTGFGLLGKETTRPYQSKPASPATPDLPSVKLPDTPAPVPDTPPQTPPAALDLPSTKPTDTPAAAVDAPPATPSSDSAPSTKPTANQAKEAAEPTSNQSADTPEPSKAPEVKQETTPATERTDSAKSAGAALDASAERLLHNQAMKQAAAELQKPNPDILRSASEGTAYQRIPTDAQLVDTSVSALEDGVLLTTKFKSNDGKDWQRLSWITEEGHKVSIETARNGSDELRYLYTSKSGTVELTDHYGWYAPRGKSYLDKPHDSPVKVHVRIEDAKALRNVQAAIMDAIARGDKQLMEHLGTWKVLEPEYALMDAKHFGKGQQAKAFTLYAASPEAAEALALRVDQLLMENNLASTQAIGSRETCKSIGQSNRVTLTRDVIARSIDSTISNPLALLDQAIVDRIHQQLNIPSSQQLSSKQLGALEKQFGLKTDYLKYDSTGKLSLDLQYGGKDGYHGGIYMPDQHSQTFGTYTSRNAYYALARGLGLDPVDLLLH